MDEIKINLSTRFMRRVVSKWIARVIRKKYGYKVDIHICELDISSIDGETSINTNVEIKLEGDEFKKIVKDIVEGV